MGMAYGKEFPAQTPFQCDGLSLGSLLKALSHSDEKVIMALLQLRTYTHICAQQASTLEDVDFNVCSVPYFFRGGELSLLSRDRRQQSPNASKAEHFCIAEAVFFHRSDALSDLQKWVPCFTNFLNNFLSTNVGGTV